MHLKTNQINKTTNQINNLGLRKAWVLRITDGLNTTELYSEGLNLNSEDLTRADEIR